VCLLLELQGRPGGDDRDTSRILTLLPATTEGKVLIGSIVESYRAIESRDVEIGAHSGTRALQGVEGQWRLFRGDD
jgi:hypothetical protein